jgi:D-alanyl-D-alanine carboxypeptidase (penicillin-binding protein 5/6)
VIAPRGLRAAALALLTLLAPVSLVAGGPAFGRTGPPPTPVPVPGGGTSPSPFPQALHTPAPSGIPPEIHADSAALAELDSGQMLFEEAGDEERPIASLTKIMTALLVLRGSDATDVVTVSPDAAVDRRIAGISELGLQEGERITVGQLLSALLLQSANDAAVALAEHLAGSVDAFVQEMNRRAHALGMRRTRFASPNGLDDTGYSTAGDLVTLTRAAERIGAFRSIVATMVDTIPAPHGSPPRVVQNRNALLWLYPGATGVKTGFTSAAGNCLVATAERDGLRLVAVVLGEPGEPFSDAAALLNYGFTGFERRDLIAAGVPLGTIDVQGRPVRVASGRSVRDALVPTGAQVRRVLVVSHVAFPPAIGQRVGTVRLTARAVDLPSVPLVVAGVPPPPEAPPGPWWRRAASSLARAIDVVVDALLG